MLPRMSDPIDPGSPAPDFDLPDQAGERHTLADHRGRWLVLFFYPKDATPGCTREACDFRDLSARFHEAGAAVFGVSPDPVKSHARFAEKQALNFPLLADDGAAVCTAYGVWQEKSMYGKKYLGVARTTYLIDPEGLVAERWDHVKVPDHAQAVLNTLHTHATPNT